VRAAQATAGVVDTCSVKAAPVPGPRGFDGAKKVNGINRHVVVDTLGLLVAVLVTAANVQDPGPHFLGCSPESTPAAQAFGTSGPTRATAAPSSGWSLAGAAPPSPSSAGSSQRRLRRPAAPVGGQRSFAWMHLCRRLNRQYEQTRLPSGHGDPARSTSCSHGRTASPNRYDEVVRHTLALCLATLALFNVFPDPLRNACKPNSRAAIDGLGLFVHRSAIEA
jgi:hypothetical protein